MGGTVHGSKQAGFHNRQKELPCGKSRARTRRTDVFRWLCSLSEARFVDQKYLRRVRSRRKNGERQKKKQRKKKRQKNKKRRGEERERRDPRKDEWRGRFARETHAYTRPRAQTYGEILYGVDSSRKSPFAVANAFDSLARTFPLLVAKTLPTAEYITAGECV